MALLKPVVGGKQHPFGVPLDVTPSQFGSSDPTIRINGKLRILAYVGSADTLGLHISNDAGFSFVNQTFTFPSDHLLDKVEIDSQYLGDLYLATTNTGTNRIFTYHSPDDGLSWNQLYDITLSSLFGTGTWVFNSQRIFPTSGGLYQVVQGFRTSGGATIDNKYAFLKDGNVLTVEAKPIVNNGLHGIKSSVYDGKYEKGFFNIPTQQTDGGDEIWRITSSGFSKVGDIPVETGLRQIAQMFYVPKYDALILRARDIWRSFDDGATLQRFENDAFIKGAGVVGPGLTGLAELDDASIVRTGDLFEDVSSTFAYGDVLTGLDSGEWHIAHVMHVWRRQSKNLLQFIEGSVPT